MTYQFSSIHHEQRGAISVITLDRPEKFNAIGDTLLREIEAFFTSPPEQTKVVVMRSSGKHFCAGLDLSEHQEKDGLGALAVCRDWHKVFGHIQYSGLPVVAAMNGGVIGGGMELAMTAHVRIAEPDTFYQLPEGRRAIFVGGGATVRVGRIIGVDRMIEMMLTGRKYNAEEGQALGCSQYLVDTGKAFDKAMELAEEIAGNAPMSNYMAIQAIPRINDMSRDDGYFVEALAAAMAQNSDEAKAGMQAFLNKQDVNFSK